MRNRFSEFKKSEKIAITRTTKVGHSISDKWKSMRKPGKLIDNTWDALDTATTATGAVATGTCIAVVTGATGAFATAMTAATGGVALGVVGLVLLAHSKYSRREDAHKELSGHVWSLIDDEAPDPGDIQAMAAASLTLLIEGQAQFAIMNDKLKAAADKLVKFEATLGPYTAWLEDTKRYDPGIPEKSHKSFKQFVFARYYRIPIFQQMLDKAFVPDGELFEYLRRVNHFGNYVQAPSIIAEHLTTSSLTTPSPSTTKVIKVIKDNISTMAISVSLRATVKRWADKLDRIDRNQLIFLNNAHVKEVLFEP